MKVFKKDTPITGIISSTSDKSCSHRALILASQMMGRTKISNLLEADDVMATKQALIDLGVKIEKEGEDYIVYGSGLASLVSPEGVLDLGNSGTGVRLLMGLVSTQPVKAIFTGDQSLSKRPMARVLKPLEKFNIEYNARDENYLPVQITGNTEAVAVNHVIEVASAQVKTALMLAAINAHGRSKFVETELTRDHTELMMQYLGFDVECEITNGAKEITVCCNEDLPAKDINVAGDPSSAAFMAAAALLVPGSEIVIENVLINKYRVGFYEVLKLMGAHIEYQNVRNDSGEKVADIKVKYSELSGIEVPAEYAPSMIDEYPILAVLATQAKGKTKMLGLKELRVKESDRLSAINENLQRCGVYTTCGEDWLEVQYCENIRATEIIKSYHDHRIAMSFLILGFVSLDGIEVDDISMIATSFPDFFDKLKDLEVDFEQAS